MNEPIGGGLGDTLRYLVVLSRPRFWLYLAGPVMVGVAYGAGSVTDLGSTAAIVLGAYFLVPANVFLYGINDVFDADVDAANPKKNEREARWSGDSLVAAAIAVSGLSGVVTVFVTPPTAWPYLVGFFGLAIGYSAPPLRFKTTPIADSMSNGLYVLPGAAAYVALAGSHPPVPALVGGWAWTMAMHTFSAIPDIDPDRRAGIRTTATWLGERYAFAYCFAWWVGAAVAFSALDARIGALLWLYPAFVAWIAIRSMSVARAYWWFPVLNTAAGTLLTIGGLWRLVPLPEGVP